MTDTTRHVRDSVALDAAYLERSVPEAIARLADESMQEVRDARDSYDVGNAGTEDDAPVV
jgi:hypothetical protein